MAFDKSKLLELNEEIGEELEDLTNPVNTSGRPLPEAGHTRMRFIEYIELGTTATTFTQPGGKKKTTVAPRVSFGFELSGKNHPPLEYDNKLSPHVLRIKSSKGTNAKSGYIKLFKAMVGDVSDAKNYIALLGDGLQGKVQHREFAKADGSTGKAAHLGNATDGFTVSPATYEDPADNTLKTLKIDEAIEPIRLFLWDRPSLEMWDSLYIEGAWDNGDVKNEWQERIKRADNFKGSPIYELLLESGREDEIELAQFDSRKPAAADPLGEASDDSEAADKAAAAGAAAKAAAKAAAADEAKKAAAKPKPAAKPAAKPKPAPAAEPEEAANDTADADSDDDEMAALEAQLAAAKAAAAQRKAAAKAAQSVDPMDGEA